ncbi:hypothetical protein [Streptomyces sp. 7N604]|uniref:hypothetical protein n=1 Tax=Streptomyces sp. 7N604 TaxID=3457415 RepID=UPI003FD0FD15
MVHARAGMLPGPRAARRYRILLAEAGFHHVAVEMHTGVFTDAMWLPMLSGLAEAACSAGAINREEADAWVAEQQQRSRAGRLFLAVPIFAASAVKP